MRMDFLIMGRVKICVDMLAWCVVLCEAGEVSELRFAINVDVYTGVRSRDASGGAVK